MIGKKINSFFCWLCVKGIRKRFCIVCDYIRRNENEGEMKIIDEIIEILNEDNGAMIPRPASKDDITQCQKMLVDIGLEPLPQGYIDFLKKNNGLAWNGIIFYSTDQVSAVDDPHGFKIMDLYTMNDEFNNRFELDEKVLLGIADDDYYTYNIETKKYEILEFTSRELMEEFDNFEDLFFFTVGGRLGLNEKEPDTDGKYEAWD